MKRTYVNGRTRRKILERDNYSCVKCGFNKIYTVEDIPINYKKSFALFILFKREITHNHENKILEYVDNGGDIEDIIFNWLSPQGLEIDHIIAVCLGGTNDEDNLRCLCRECHRKKTNKDLAILSIRDIL